MPPRIPPFFCPGSLCLGRPRCILYPPSLLAKEDVSAPPTHIRRLRFMQQPAGLSAFEGAAMPCTRARMFMPVPPALTLSPCLADHLSRLVAEQGSGASCSIQGAHAKRFYHGDHTERGGGRSSGRNNIASDLSQPSPPPNQIRPLFPPLSSHLFTGDDPLTRTLTFLFPFLPRGSRAAAPLQRLRLLLQRPWLLLLLTSRRTSTTAERGGRPEGNG